MKVVIRNQHLFKQLKCGMRHYIQTNLELFGRVTAMYDDQEIYNEICQKLKFAGLECITENVDKDCSLTDRLLKVCVVRCRV